MEAMYYKVVIVHVNRSLASFELHFLKYFDKTPGTKISIQLQKVSETFQSFLILCLIVSKFLGNINILSQTGYLLRSEYWVGKRKSSKKHIPSL